MASGAKVELKVAGPHAVQRRVIADARSGGLPDVTRRSGGCYCERVSMGAAAALSAWPPALRELVAYLLSMLAVLLRRSAS